MPTWGEPFGSAVTSSHDLNARGWKELHGGARCEHGEVMGVGSWMISSVSMMILNKRAIDAFPHEIPGWQLFGVALLEPRGSRKFGRERSPNHTPPEIIMEVDGIASFDDQCPLQTEVELHFHDYSRECSTFGVSP